MTTRNVANRLVALCMAGQFIMAQKELYDTDVVSVETDGGRMEGLLNMVAKEQRFLDNLDRIRHIDFSEPLIAGNYFSVKLIMDVDMKNAGHKTFEELCVYKVMNGKIVFEQFFRN